MIITILQIAYTPGHTVLDISAVNTDKLIYTPESIIHHYFFIATYSLRCCFSVKTSESMMSCRHKNASEYVKLLKTIQPAGGAFDSQSSQPMTFGWFINKYFLS